MAITVDDSGVIFKDQNPIIIPRDGNYDEVSFLGGFDASDNFTFGRFTSDGKLKVDATVNPVGNVLIQAKDSLDVIQDLRCVTDPVTSFEALVVQDPRMTFSGGAMAVTMVEAPSPGAFNKFGTLSVPPSAWTTVVSQSVPAGMTLQLECFVVWGDVDGEWSVNDSVSQLGGCRTSPSKLTETVEYCEAIVYSNPGPGPKTVRIQAKHYASVSVDMYSNMIGRLV